MNGPSYRKLTLTLVVLVAAVHSAVRSSSEKVNSSPSCPCEIREKEFLLESAIEFVSIGMKNLKAYHEAACSSEVSSSSTSNVCKIAEVRFLLGKATKFVNTVMENLKVEPAVCSTQSDGSSNEIAKLGSSSASSTTKTTEIPFRRKTTAEVATTVQEIWKETVLTGCHPKPQDCQDVYSCGTRLSGVYRLLPKNVTPEKSALAYCDMETDGGGWTVIQRRGDFGRPQDYFFKDWKAYKAGFGNLTEDFWIGNDLLFVLTNQKNYSIRFDLQDLERNNRWAKYSHFRIDSEKRNYTLHVSGYQGDAGDSFSYHNGQQFSTKERDNDKHSANCAVLYKGAWWYNACYQSNLNGLYLTGNHKSSGEGIVWNVWHRNPYSLPITEMKIKPFP